MVDDNRFARLGILYAIGQVVSKGISFVLLPIYIKQLGMIGFGQLSLVDAVLDFIASFTILGIYSGYIRFYRDYNEEQRLSLKNTALSFALLISMLNIILSLTLGKYVSSFIFNFNNSYYILLLVVARSIISQLVILLMCDYGLNFKARINVTLNLVNLLLNLVFTFALVVYKKRGIIGIYEGYILSNLIMFIYLMKVKDSKFKFEVDKDMLRNMLKFSVGLIPSCIAATILTLSDRYFLKGFRDITATGIYSVGYKFGMLIEPLFVSPFKQIFTPYKFSIWKDKDSQDKFNSFYFKYHFIGCFIALAICIYSKTMIMLLSSKDSIIAYKVVPLIVMAYFFYGKASFYSMGIQIKNKTYYDGFIMLSAGAINLILNLILIPKLGMYGAAVSTTISYLVMNCIYVRFSLPLYYIKFEGKKVYKIYFMTFVLYSIYYVISILNIFILFEIIIGAVLLTSYIICSVHFNLISLNELTNYLVKIKKS
ncbi:lipopolysaccharide biosynthesis protein [Candidatus Clostridium stratigraminis]|uniref:Oligosaccharide flippase family protein n=1 Tax=Candidatus Clostridium stratigraminis TaxID=3381661 RepID=A0ABW8T0R1_9CLOT